jgi:cytochrome c553
MCAVAPAGITDFPDSPDSPMSFNSTLVAVTGLLLATLTGAASAQAPDAAPPKAALCGACHGATGNPVMPEVPTLAGQTARYIYLQLRDFQEGRRHSELMSPMAKDLSRDEMRQLGAWFGAQSPVAQPFAVDAEKARLGKLKSDETLCTMCHLGGFKGQNEIPRVSNQPYDYIVKQLRAFKAKTRTNDAGNMTSVAGTLNDADIENIAHYIVSQ